MHGPALIRRLVEAGWPAGTLINVNFPGCAADEVDRRELVPQGQYDLQSTEIEERIDARQRAYYWIGLRRRKAAPPADSDLGAVYADKIAVTPLHLNLTEQAVLEKCAPTLGAEVNEVLKPELSHCSLVTVKSCLNLLPTHDPFRDIVQKA